MKVWEPWQNLLQTFPTLAWIWIAMLGACIGSFLNVVVYRMPAGKSLSHPGSHCPRCGHAIRWFDNIPILGWMGLLGRCRDCRAPISVRYPLVELVVTLIFAWQWREHVMLPSGPDGPTALNLRTFVWYVTWYTTMVAISLIEADGQPIPRNLLIFPVVVCLWLSLLWRDTVEQVLNPAPVLGGVVVYALDGLKRGFDRLRKKPVNRPKDERGRWVVGLLAGIFLGMRVALPILVLATVTEWIVGQRREMRRESIGETPPAPRWRWSATILFLAAIWPLLDQFR